MGEVETHQVRLRSGRQIEVGAVGPDDGRPILYFHSPSTSGEELASAESAATQANVRLVTIRRPSMAGDEPSEFVALVAKDAVAVIDALALTSTVLLAWSGGAPYALATSAAHSTGIDAVHLVSPVPGPLNGPDAVPNLSDRLQQVANTTANSPWVTNDATLRDYQAVASPWNFNPETISERVTIWAPTNDEIVPPHLAQHLAASLGETVVLEVPGAHDWLIQNWSTVLEQMAG